MPSKHRLPAAAGPSSKKPKTTPTPTPTPQTPTTTPTKVIPKTPTTTSNKSKMTPQRPKTSDDDDVEPMITSWLEPGASASTLVLTGKRKEFYDALISKLESTDPDDSNTKGELDMKSSIASLIGILFTMDARHFEEQTRDMTPDAASHVIGDNAATLLDIWARGTKVGKAIPRPGPTRNAQLDVAKWYCKICVVTGVDQPTEPAHIFPNCIDRNPLGKERFLSILRVFWTAKDIAILETLLNDPKHEERNIVVLQNNVHRLWDTFVCCFKLLPGFTDTRQELEFLWIKPGRSSTGAPSHDRRRRTAIAIPLARGGGEVFSGQKVILETRDPVKYPLPYPGLWNLSYSLHSALHAVASAEVIERFFRGPPPPPRVPANNPTSPTSDDDAYDDDDTYESSEIRVPYLKEHLIDSALALGVIKPDEVPGWRLCFNPACTDPSRPLYDNPPEMEEDEERVSAEEKVQESPEEEYTLGTGNEMGRDDYSA